MIPPHSRLALPTVILFSRYLPWLSELAVLVRAFRIDRAVFCKGSHISIYYSCCISEVGYGEGLNQLWPELSSWIFLAIG